VVVRSISNVHYFPGVNILVAIFAGMVGEIPNKHLSLVPAKKKHVFYFKHVLKLIKIETLRALGDQDSSPTNFKYELGKALQKKNPDLVLSGIPTQGTWENLIFFVLSHQVLDIKIHVKFFSNFRK
jgi:hypothetical protein